MRSELHDLFIPANQTKEPMSTDDKQWQYLQWDPKWMTINYSQITNFGAFCEQCNKHTTFKQLFHFSQLNFIVSAHLRYLPQGTLLWQWFSFKDIKNCPRYPSLVQCTNKTLFINDVSSSNINKNWRIIFSTF